MNKTMPKHSEIVLDHHAYVKIQTQSSAKKITIYHGRDILTQASERKAHDPLVTLNKPRGGAKGIHAINTSMN